jgi:hypothetical protein
MDVLRQRTALDHDRVMIFPQGEFSTEAGRVLKLNGFVAAANTEVTPTKESGNEPRVADLWDVAISRYGDFPIYTRRYANHGVENFAFDLLLGKPCLLVTHHNEFKDDAPSLIKRIDELNALPCKLVWCSLGDVIVNSYKMRNRGDDTEIIQMYAKRLIVENADGEEKIVEICKRETDPNCVDTVRINGKECAWTLGNGCIRFHAAISAKSRVSVDISYMDQLGSGLYRETVGYEVRTRIRRYLSEVRDQYICRSKTLIYGATWVRKAWKRAA